MIGYGFLTSARPWPRSDHSSSESLGGILPTIESSSSSSPYVFLTNFFGLRLVLDRQTSLLGPARRCTVPVRLLAPLLLVPHDVDDLARHPGGLQPLLGRRQVDQHISAAPDEDGVAEPRLELDNG